MPMYQEMMTRDYYDHYINLYDGFLILIVPVMNYVLGFGARFWNKSRK
ncbi:hypothetical protein VCRA217O17_20294 [Vibrio crassostreae]|nr:hypothetical protein VCRA217O17_20294 [Vibrio crassostreae]